MQSSGHLPKADQATTERAKVLAPFGFTERQAHFLATVMRHSGVFVGRQYAAFARITHGQKVHDFIEKLLVRRLVTPIELGSTGRTRIFHVHHKPLYAAIGEPDNRNRRRVTIERAIERLMVLDGVLADRSVTWLGTEREKRRCFRERFGDRLRDDEYPRLVFGKRQNVTVRYFPDKLPIGYDRDHRRHVFMYLARSRSPMDFRVFILRQLELLNALGFWTIRVLFPRSLAESMEAYRTAAHELLAKPLTPSQTEELIWFLRQPQSEASFHDFDEFERLVGMARSEPLALLVVLLGGEAGLRCGEIMALEWTEVDFAKRQLTVTRSEWKGHVTTPKGGRIRYVPMTRRLTDALREARHLRGPRVLCDATGNSLTQKVLQVLVRRTARRANVKPGIHILRHTFCSHLAMRGAPARAIQELAGHQDLGTTQRYMHLSPAALDAAIRLLETGTETSRVVVEK